MSAGVRVALYAVLGLVLVVAFDPRTWGHEVEARGGDEIGLVLGAQWAASFLAAMIVLGAVVVAVEANHRARAAKCAGSSTPVDTPPNRSWYE